MKKIVGVIPARWQSSRFPGKPLADILGKSLIQRTYENASRSKSLDALVIATDDQRIFDHAQSFGAEIFMTSPACPAGTDRVWEVIEKHFPEAEIVVNIQGDEPCLDPEVVDRLVAKMRHLPESVLITPVAQILDPHLISSTRVVKCVFDKGGKALYFSRSPIPFAQNALLIHHYYRHLGIYCFRREALCQYVLLEKTPLQEREDLEQLKMLENGFPIHVCIVEDQAIGVDTPEDIKMVINLLT